MNSQELELLSSLSENVIYIKNILEIIKNSFLWFLGVSIALLVIYILYRFIDSFISF